MSQFRRYAIYYTPPRGSALAQFGAAWLGWDVETGQGVPHPDCSLDVAALTETPRKYGFHGTLKAPFRLAGGASQADLEQAAQDLAAGQAAFHAPPLALSRLGRFLALIPSAPSAPLADLAGRAVTELDRFRAPPDQDELARRRTAGLSPEQDAMLVRWGYPHVLDQFRFHLTLTGKLDAAQVRAAEPVVAHLTAGLTRGPMPVDDLTLCGERSDGRFQVIRRLALAGH